MKWIYSMWTCPECNQKFVNRNHSHSCNEKSILDFIDGKSDTTLELFNHLIFTMKEFAEFELHPARTRISFASRIRFGYIHRLGKNYIDVVLQFPKAYKDNLCFHKIAQIPGTSIYNHYFRLYSKDDLNDEVIGFLKMAYEKGK